jgi:dCMP deaminase
MTARATWEDYFLGIAGQVASRGTCDRRRVGAVFVRDRMILATGYNGSIRGVPHCDDLGHDMLDGHCVRTVHAEVNALAQAARNGTRLDGAELYCTDTPCWGCFKTVVNAGVRSIYASAVYRTDERVLAVLREFGGIQIRVRKADGWEIIL